MAVRSQSKLQNFGWGETANCSKTLAAKIGHNNGACPASPWELISDNKRAKHSSSGSRSLGRVNGSANGSYLRQGSLSPASLQGPGDLSLPFPARLAAWFCSHHFPHSSAPSHVPDGESYVTASLESHIALGRWSESTCFCLAEQERSGRSYLWGNKPFPTGVMGFVSTSMEDLRRSCRDVLVR